MNYYVIGIGGTGAKCIEALTHLSAAGMMPEGELYALFVDPDRSNGSLERAQVTLQQYVNCKQLQLGTTNLFKTGIIRANPDVWSPFSDESRPRLDNFFHYTLLRETKPEAAHLFDVLYSPAEKETTLERGFRGHPSIGAAVMTKTVRLGQGEPWQTFRNRIAQEGKGGPGAKIFLFGSIFGGTGASGFPTIARLIDNELVAIGKENVKLGGALVLPYFSFTPDTNDNELKASSENFPMNTQAALKYYYQQANTKIYKAVYLCGDESQSPVAFSIGGNTQRNEPHFIELYAALAAIDFFQSKNPQGYPLLARHQANQLDWKDLPDSNGGNTVKQKIERLARFAFAYLSVYLPMLENIRANGKGYRAPWCVDFFERQNISIGDNATQTSLEDVKKYCESFLLWLANVQTSARDEKIHLVNHFAFAETRDGEIVLKPPQNFTLNNFSNLILPTEKENPNALNKLWERMCDAKGKARNAEGKRDQEAQGVGTFIHALYDECAK
ncbi:hypothetical protein HYR99_06605 [Candidatus Poribacteria bacterium]|nr:hypothetical protein [Candidatus Poribacteria bacterium]